MENSLKIQGKSLFFLQDNPLDGNFLIGENPFGRHLLYL